MTTRAIAVDVPIVRTKLNRQQIVGFWAAWSGWLLDGMDSVIYALVLAPALTELLPRSGTPATPTDDHAIAYDSSRDRLVSFGGFGGPDQIWSATLAFFSSIRPAIVTSNFVFEVRIF